jgi:uncharacterized protein YbjT (DUF2867 family)
MNELTATVIGATGLIGSLVLEELLKDDHFKTVRALVRRDLNMNHPKLQQSIVNFNDINDFTKRFGEGDIIFCCIGTTQKKVKGDLVAYAKIDFDIPVNAARIGVSKNYKKFLIVSSVGANENSSNFYLQLKGKTENALKQFEFESLEIFQPSILTGKRNEKRITEQIAQATMKFISFLFIGALKKYKPVAAKNVAKAMVAVSKKATRGVHYYQYAQMIKLANH